MKRTFITNLALLIFLNLMVKPFWVFGIDRKVQNLVGTEEYGFYFSLLSFSMLLNIILDAGVTNYNNRAVSMNQGLFHTYLSRIVPLKFCLALIYALVTIVAGVFIGYSGEQFKLLYVLIFNQFLLSFILYLRSNISGLHLFRTDSYISVLDRSLMILFCSLLIWGNIINQQFRIEWFVYIQTVSYLLTALIAALIVLSKSGMIKLQISWKHTFPLLKNTYPYALLILLMSLFNRVDLVMMERLLTDGKVQAGIYAQSFRILDAAAMIAFLFAGLLLPLFSRMISKKEPIEEIIRLSYILLIIPAVSIAAILSVYSDFIISSLYHENIELSSDIFTLLIINFIFISVTYIFGSLLTANGNIRELTILAFIALIINITLNIILIPVHKAMGAVISSISTQAFFAVAQLILSKRIFKWRFDYILFTRFISFIILLITAVLITYHHISDKLAGIALVAVIAFSFALLLRMFIPSEIIRIIKIKTEIIE